MTVAIATVTTHPLFMLWLSSMALRGVSLSYVAERLVTSSCGTSARYQRQVIELLLMKDKILLTTQDLLILLLFSRPTPWLYLGHLLCLTPKLPSLVATDGCSSMTVGMLEAHWSNVAWGQRTTLAVCLGADSDHQTWHYRYNLRIIESCLSLSLSLIQVSLLFNIVLSKSWITSLNVRCEQRSWSVWLVHLVRSHDTRLVWPVFYLEGGEPWDFPPLSCFSPLWKLPCIIKLIVAFDN